MLQKDTNAGSNKKSSYVNIHNSAQFAITHAQVLSSSTLHTHLRFIFTSTHGVCVDQLVSIFCMVGTRGVLRAKGAGTIGGRP